MSDKIGAPGVKLNTGDLNHIIDSLGNLGIGTDIPEEMAREIGSILSGGRDNHAIGRIINIVLGQKNPKNIVEVLLLSILKVQTVYGMSVEDDWPDDEIQERFEKASCGGINNVFVDTSCSWLLPSNWCSSGEELKEMNQKGGGISKIYGVPESNKRLINFISRKIEEDDLLFIEENIIQEMLGIEKIYGMSGGDNWEKKEFQGKFDSASQEGENQVIVYPSQTYNIGPGFCNSVENLIMYFQDGGGISNIYGVPKMYFGEDEENTNTPVPSQKVDT